MIFAPLGSSSQTQEVSQILAYKLLEDESSIVYNSIVYKITTERMDNIQVKEEMHEKAECEHHRDSSLSEILGYSGLSLLLILFGGLMSGLTIGFFTIGKEKII